MSGIEPNKRPTALIFQNLALFPLMTVAENIGYGLRVRGVSKTDRLRRAEELLQLVALPDQGGKRVYVGGKDVKDHRNSGHEGRPKACEPG